MMFRRTISAMAVPTLIASVWLLGSASPASAAAMQPTTGTYQLNIQGDSPQTMVLSKHHVATFSSGTGTWASQRSDHVTTITVDVQGGQAPYTTCMETGQGSVCYFEDQYTGPKTSTGIGSESDPGEANAYVGSYLIESEPCWAVRTGGVHSGKS